MRDAIDVSMGGRNVGRGYIEPTKRAILIENQMIDDNPNQYSCFKFLIFGEISLYEKIVCTYGTNGTALIAGIV